MKLEKLLEQFSPDGIYRSGHDCTIALISFIQQRISSVVSRGGKKFTQKQCSGFVTNPVFILLSRHKGF